MGHVKFRMKDESLEPNGRRAIRDASREKQNKSLINRNLYVAAISANIPMEYTI